jgi:hypothetical protein
LGFRVQDLGFRSYGLGVRHALRACEARKEGRGLRDEGCVLRGEGRGDEGEGVEVGGVRGVKGLRVQGWTLKGEP